MAALRIVHAVCTAAFAGVERYVTVLAASQRDSGHQVAVIGGDPVSMRAALDRGQVRYRPAATVLSAVRAIDAWRRCDVLHVHMTAAEAASVLAVRAWHVPVVASRHFAQTRGLSIPGHWAAPLIRRRVSAQIAVSRWVAAGIDGDSTVVYPGVPSLPGRRPAAQREPSVLVAQRLEAEKETRVAIEAFGLSGLADRGWRLDIAGDGAQRSELTRLAHDIALDSSVHFLGFRSDIPALLQEAGILLASAPSEHFGLTVLEAMAAGLPVVATGAAGHLETMGAAAAPAVFPPGDAVTAAALLSRLADDVGGRDAYGAELQAIQRDRFTVEAQARSTEAVYRSVL